MVGFPSMTVETLPLMIVRGCPEPSNSGIGALFSTVLCASFRYEAKNFQSLCSLTQARPDAFKRAISSGSATIDSRTSKRLWLSPLLNKRPCSPSTIISLRAATFEPTTTWPIAIDSNGLRGEMNSHTISGVRGNGAMSMMLWYRLTSSWGTRPVNFT